MEDAEYIFVTKCIERTTELLNIIQVFDSQATKFKCSLQRLAISFQSRKSSETFCRHNFFFHVNGSLENIQVDLFEKEICGGLKLSIFQYSILQFQSSTLGGIFFSCVSHYLS